MALKNMSIKETMKIYNRYADMIADNEPGGYYPYSALGGYDIFDVDNSIKIFIAKQIYEKDLQEDAVKQLKEWGNCGIMFFTDTFIPDEHLYELNKLIQGSSEYRMKKMGLKYLTPIGMTKLFYEEKKESAGSFLTFCLWVRKNRTDYWKEIYNRLGIENK
jgi:hypothetical protein